MKKTLFIISVLFALSFEVFPQSEDEFLLPEGLGVANQLKYSYDLNKKIEIFENWFNVDYRKGIFSAGIRLDVFQPNDPSPAVNRGKLRYADLAFKYIKIDLGSSDFGFDVTAGNYYALFGRGLLLKIYEDRNVRIDNNLLGLKINASYSDFYLTALSGMAENSADERKDIVHGVDLEYRGLKFLRMGTSYVLNRPEDQNQSITQLNSFRIQPSLSFVDAYAEYGIKQNQDERNAALQKSVITGKGFYGNLNFYIDKFSLLGEYKNYDNFSFESSDKTIFYNTPPAVRKEYSYVLLNRHPSPLDASNERGFQVEGNYSFNDETSLVASYSETKTQNNKSLFQILRNINLPVFTQLREVFVQANRTWNESFNTIAALGYNEELSSNTKNITPILEVKYYYRDINTFRFIVEHQQSHNKTTAEKYFDDVFTFEYLRSPGFSASMVAELQTKEPTPGRKVRKFWGFLQLGYNIFEHTNASILFGSRQAGNICIGGVCRYEPEFSGIELRMTTRL